MRREMHMFLFLLIPLVVGQDIVPFKEKEEDCGLDEELKYTMYNVIHETLARLMPRFISDIKDTGKSLIELEDKSKTLLSQFETLEQTVQKMKMMAGLPEFSCTFEPQEICFLQNATNDDFDWTTRKGQTPSSGTGPQSASEGLYYSYIEVSGPRKSGDTASLVSKWIITGGEKCLLFDYHMQGGGIGLLKVLTYNATDEDVIYVKLGDQGCEWNTAIIPLINVNNYELRIDGVKGNTYAGDIAIDNVKIVAEKCENSTLQSLNKSCPSGWVYYSSSCYKYFQYPRKDWASAKRYCNSLQSNLVEIENSSENEFLRKYLETVTIPDIQDPMYQFWIGHSDCVSEGVWTTTGSNSGYTDWYANEPNGGTYENCVTMFPKYDYHWNDAPCSSEVNFICEKEI